MPDDGGSPYDYFRGRVMFPIGDRAGRIIAFGGRDAGRRPAEIPEFAGYAGLREGTILYGWAAARANVAREPTAAAVIVVEGYMDVIALHRAGFGGAVAPLGTALTETQLHELWRLAPEPVLCFDGDTAGQRAALRALARALPLLQPGRSLRFAALPAGEDPDSLIRGGGPGAFAQILAAARPLSEMLWQTELNAGPIDTPERRADFERRLMAQAGLIADRTVQNEYRRFFRDRLFALGETGPAGAARPAAARPGAASPAGRGWRRPMPRRRCRRRPAGATARLVLGIFIAHPALIDEWVEDLAALDFPEPELDNLRRSILEVAAYRSGA